MGEFVNTVDLIGDEALTTSIVDRTITEYKDNTVKFLRKYAFANAEKLETLDLPMCEEIGDNALYKCTSLKNINLPLVRKIPYATMEGCVSLETVKLPLVTSIAANSFNSCYNLKQLDFSSYIPFYANSFANCYSMIALIIRTETVCSLSSNLFSSWCHFTGTVNATYNPDGLKDGYIYVPRALVEDYKAAKNWSTYATQFRALEDYTVDGTITGELDESKI